MVLVVFWYVKFSYSFKRFYNQYLEMDFSVAGYMPSGYQDVIDFVSKTFSVFLKDYSMAKTPKHLILRDTLKELSSEKKILTIVPEDAYHDEVEGREVVFFVDTGNKDKHVFTVEKDERRLSEAQRYLIHGHGFNTGKFYNIGVNFLPDANTLIRDLETYAFVVNKRIEKNVGKWDKLIRDKEIHYGVLSIPNSSDLRVLKEIMQNCTTIEFP